MDADQFQDFLIGFWVEITGGDASRRPRLKFGCSAMEEEEEPRFTGQYIRTWNSLAIIIYLCYVTYHPYMIP